MTEAQIMQIKKEKNNKEFNREFIEYADKEWQKIIQIFRSCRYDLSKIKIVKR